VPTVAGVEHIEPKTVARLVQEHKCLLVDLRGDDRASGLIEGAVHVPAIDTVPFVAKVPELVRQWADQRLVIFTCQYSAHRAPQCANWYRAQASPLQHVAILSGGFRGWESEGLPVQSLASTETAQKADEVAMQLGTHFVQAAPAQELQAQAPSQQELGAAAVQQHVVPQMQQVQQLQQAQPQQMQLMQTMPQVQMPVQQVEAAPQLQQVVPQAPQPPQPPQLTQPPQPPQAQAPQAQRQPSTTTPAAEAQSIGTPTTAPLPKAGSYVPPHLPNTVPTIKDVEHIDPPTVLELVQGKKCLLVDLRGEDRASGLIEGAIHEPAIDTVPFTTKVPKLVQQWAGEGLVIFTCQYSAHRAPQCANWYREKADPAQRVAILSGGFRGWEACGMPIQHGPTDRAEAKKADEVAVKLGTKFVEGCLAGVPGGGFCMPQPVKNPPPKAPQPQQAAPPQAKAAPAPAPQPQATSAGGYVPPHLPNTVPTIENVENIDPKTVHELLQSRSCLLVDLRGEDRAAGLIDGAVHEPAIDTVPFPTKVPKLVQQWADQSLVVFTCQYSAHRAPQCANWYRQKANPGQRVAILSGGFRGWEAMGLPVRSLASAEQGQAADEAAKTLGAKFAGSAGGYVARVPGGGFSIQSH